MKRLFVSACAVVFLAATCPLCVAQSSPWDGSWKLISGSVKYVGPTFTVSTDADGYTITRMGTASPKTVCDGSAQSRPDGSSYKCMKAGSGYTVESMDTSGKPISKTTIAMSADGTKMTREAHYTPSDRAPYTMTSTSKKVSGSGNNTVWKQIDMAESQDTGVLTIKVNGDSVDFKETDNDKPMTCKLDGTPMEMDGRSMSVKQVDASTLKVTYSSSGKVQRENTFVLSKDGKSIKEVDVTPDPSPSTTSLMLRKM